MAFGFVELSLSEALNESQLKNHRSTPGLPDGVAIRLGTMHSTYDPLSEAIKPPTNESSSERQKRIESEKVRSSDSLSTLSLIEIFVR